MIALVLWHAPYLNGPYYWVWGWQRLPFWRAWPGVLIAAVPFFLAQQMHDRVSATTRTRLVVGLGSLMLAAFVLELNTLVLAAGKLAPDRLWMIVEDSRVTSYYTDALLTHKVIPTIKDWLSLFPEFIGRLHIHSRNKPPGSMLFYLAFATRFPTDQHQAASLAGLAVGVLATGAIPATFFLARALGGSVSASFLAASAMALCPGFILFFPELDQVYAAVSALIVGSWMLAIRRDSRWWAVLCGALLAGTCFFTFSLLVLGWFMAGAGLYLWRVRRHCSFQRLLETGAIVTGCVAVVHAALWVILRYDVIATFKASLANQADFAANIARPYPQTAVFDLLDYALGLGWMSAVLFLSALRRRGRDDDEGRAFAWLSVSQLFVVAIGALLAVETARVWIFLFPIALHAVGRELEQWPVRQRVVFFALAMITIVVIGQNMIFFSPAPPE